MILSSKISTCCVVVVILLVVFAQFIARPFDNITLTNYFTSSNFVSTHVVFKKEDPRQVPRIRDHIVKMLIVLGQSHQIDHVEMR